MSMCVFFLTYDRDQKSKISQHGLNESVNISQDSKTECGDWLKTNGDIAP